MPSARPRLVKPPSFVLFEPAYFSDEELAFLLVHLGESPTVAMYEGVPDGVNPAAITLVLGACQEYQALADASKGSFIWSGTEPMRDAILRYLAWSEKTRQVYQRGGPRHASLCAWDGLNRPIARGIGADSDVVRTEILPDGSRKKFAVDLRQPSGEEITGDYASLLLGEVTINPAEDAILEDWDKGVVSCSICHFAQNFNPANRYEFNTARGRVIGHLARVKTDLDRHRLLLARARQGSARAVKRQIKTRVEAARAAAAEKPKPARKPLVRVKAGSKVGAPPSEE